MTKIVKIQCGDKVEEKMIHDYYMVVHNPITENKPYKIIANAVIFKNRGTNTAHIQKNYDIPAGTVEMIGSQTDTNRINQIFEISFTGGGTNNLQIATLHLRIPGIDEE